MTKRTKHQTGVFYQDVTWVTGDFATGEITERAFSKTCKPEHFVPTDRTADTDKMFYCEACDEWFPKATEEGKK